MCEFDWLQTKKYTCTDCEYLGIAIGANKDERWQYCKYNTLSGTTQICVEYDKWYPKGGYDA
jgi:hypothetical protein